MSIIYSYPTVTPEASDLLVGTEITGVGEDSPRTRTFTVGSIAALTLSGNIASNNTSVALSLAALNSAYPGVAVGFKVQCQSILKVYEKTSAGWFSYTVVNVT